MVDELGAGRVVLAHIEEMDGMTVEELGVLEGRLRSDGRPVTFAWDGLVLDV